MVPNKDVALLVIDMQNGFCKPTGSMGSLGFDVSRCDSAIGQVRKLIDAAHKADVPVIYTRYVYQADYKDGGILPNVLLPGLKEIGALAEGSWDAAIVDELTPIEGDLIIDKSRYSAFYGTRLEPLLTSLGTRNLVMCGVTTNMCVETSARVASQRDYHAHVIEDACAEVDHQRHLNAIQTISFGFGWINTIDDVLASWK